jgi:uncharacterized repeat protein (TIGR01451 family)
LLAALLTSLWLASAASAAGSDLVLTKSADVDDVFAGELVEYQLHVVNSGEDDPHVVVTDALPGNLEIVDAGSTQGSCTPGQTVVCDLGAIAAGDEADALVLALALAPAVVTNTATVAGDAEAGPPGDNVDSATVNVHPPEADLGIELAASAATIPFAGQVTYTATVSNAGPFAEDHARLRGMLSSRLTAVSASASQGSCSVPDGWLDCDLGRIAGAAGATVSVVARADESGIATSELYVSGDPNDGVVDPDQENDSASLATTVLARRSTLPLAPIFVPAPAIVTPAIAHVATGITVRRSGRRITGRVKSAPGCLGRRQVLLRRAGKGSKRYGAAVTRDDGTFKITTKRRLPGRVYVVAGKSYGADGRICDAGRSPRR